MLFSTSGSDLRLILQPCLVVKSMQPEETHPAAALVNSGIRHRRVLANWWQMSGSYGALIRESGCLHQNVGQELKIVLITGILRASKVLMPPSSDHAEILKFYSLLIKPQMSQITDIFTPNYAAFDEGGGDTLFWKQLKNTGFPD